MLDTLNPELNISVLPDRFMLATVSHPVLIKSMGHPGIELGKSRLETSQSELKQ